MSERRGDLPTPQEKNIVRLIEESKRGGKKFDGGKIPWHLAQWDALEEYVAVLRFGAFEKPMPPGVEGFVKETNSGYGPDNWRKVEPLEERYLDAAMRHLVERMRGRTHDPESKRRVLAHVMCCVAFVLQAEMEKARGSAPDAG